MIHQCHMPLDARAAFDDGDLEALRTEFLKADVAVKEAYKLSILPYEKSQSFRHLPDYKDYVLRQQGAIYYGVMSLLGLDAINDSDADAKTKEFLKVK
ncbi:hypothetical protein [Martelella soudanensis]|uniref:hypothetical protein n=1 Tax=unclassified Martelella TaxID=2629616 RepID=UPI0015DF0F3E|nr:MULTISPECIES: hypothetical protein [unclassified Martelella]